MPCAALTPPTVPFTVTAFAPTAKVPVVVPAPRVSFELLMVRLPPVPKPSVLVTAVGGGNSPAERRHIRAGRRPGDRAVAGDRERDGEGAVAGVGDLAALQGEAIVGAAVDGRRAGGAAVVQRAARTNDKWSRRRRRCGHIDCRARCERAVRPLQVERRAADIERVGSGGCGEGAFERAVGEHVERRAGIALRQAVDRRAVQIVDAAGPGGGHRRQRRAAVEAEAVARRRRGRKGPAGVGVGVGSAEVQEPEQGVGVPGGRARVLRGKRAETLNCAAGGEADNACAGARDRAAV